MTYVAILKYSLYLGWFVSGLINVCIYWKIPLWALLVNHELKENHIFHPVKTCLILYTINTSVVWFPWILIFVLLIFKIIKNELKDYLSLM